MIRTVAAGLLALASMIVATGAAVGADVGTSAGVAASSSAAPTIKITQVSPASLDVTRALVVKGTLRNPGAAITQATLRLRLKRTILNTRAEVDAWAGATSPSTAGTAGTGTGGTGTAGTGTADTGTAGSGTDGNGTTGTTAPVTTGSPLPGAITFPVIAAASTLPFTLTVPAGATGMNAFGPRGVTVQLMAGGNELAAQRTLVVWAPEGVTTSTRLSLLVPMTSDLPSTDAGGASAANAQLVAPGGRLNRVLDAASDDAIDWAIDPAVLQSVERLDQTGVVATGTPTPSGTGPGSQTSGGQAGPSGSAGASPSSAPASGALTPASPGTPGTPGSSGSGGGTATGTDQVTAQQEQQSDARSWMRRFTQGTGDRVLVGLPYADPDLNSIFDNGQPALLRTSDALGKQILLDQNLRADRTVAWPGDGRVSGKTVAGLARADRTDVLLAAGNQRPNPDDGYTPTGRSTVTAGSTRLNGLLYDEQLSALFTASGGAASANSTQWALADLAAIGLERSSSISHVLAVAPRGWDPDPVKVGGLLAALHSAPWVTLSNLDSLRQANASATERVAPAYPAAARASELPPGHITGMARLNDGLDLIAPATVDAEPELTELREQVASLVSASWRGHDVYQARLAVSKAVSPVASGVRLYVGSRVRWFTAQTQVLQVTVDNTTNFPIKVMVKLTPLSGQLSFAGPKEVRIEAGRTRKVSIETTAHAGGDVNVEARLFGPDGQQLVGTQTFKVHVRPGWERVGLIGTGSVLALLFVIGLWRNIHRGRTRVPAESVPDVDDLATASDPRTGPIDAAAIAQEAGQKAGQKAGTAP